MDQAEAHTWTNKNLYLPWPEDPDWYIDFGSVFIRVNDVNLIGKTPQKLGNWAEYLFQNIAKDGAMTRELAQKNKPLVEGVSLDGTYVHQDRGTWTTYGLMYGRPYEIKSSVNDSFEFKVDNVKAIVMSNGFFIMCRTSMIPEGIQFDYRGYTMHDVIEMGVPGIGYAPNVYVRNRSKIVAANYIIYGQTPDDPTRGIPEEIDIRVRLPGDGARLIRVAVPAGGIRPDGFWV